jgi:hypothetical protein
MDDFSGSKVIRNPQWKVNNSVKRRICLSKYGG